MLYATTTQNVAWAMTSEWKPNPTWKSNRPTSMRATNVFCNATAGDDAGQRDRQHEQERDRVPTEELEALHRERGQRAEYERDGGGRERRP